MRNVRFVIAIALIAAGCALLLAANEPQPAVVVWVGGGSHGASLTATTSQRLATKL